MSEQAIQILSMVAATLLGPALTEAGKRWEWGDRLAALVNFTLTVALYLGGWVVFDGDRANVAAWVLGGMAAAGGTGAGYNGIKQVAKAWRA